jgi:hypothetical protein
MVQGVDRARREVAARRAPRALQRVSLRDARAHRLRHRGRRAPGRPRRHGVAGAGQPGVGQEGGRGGGGESARAPAAAADGVLAGGGARPPERRGAGRQVEPVPRHEHAGGGAGAGRDRCDRGSARGGRRRPCARQGEDDPRSGERQRRHRGELGQPGGRTGGVGPGGREPRVHQRLERDDRPRRCRGEQVPRLGWFREPGAR